MKGFLSRRPSPAMIVAILALVVAMAGTGYAALKLPKNSVGTKQLKASSVTTAKLKKNAVTSAKIKKKTITGADVNLNKLGTVPSANIANTANALAPPEAVHLVGTAGQPPFLNGSNFGPAAPGLNSQPVGYYKDHEGVVHLQGLAKVGAAGPGIIFSLPPGYRPATSTILFFTAFCSGAACSDEQSGPILIGGSGAIAEGINLEGAVVGSAETAVSLDGITFRAAS